MEENKILLDEEKLMEYLHVKLAGKGYAPGAKEVEDIAEIVFDYLIEIEALEQL